ncbi:MAG: AAA family ATPase [Methanomassiliicoccales archaeon]|nr:AAA family ATPase [Methanomassiliicoccales archaeon]NYT15422.1 AAA family ATPase [Methanomassiliicoccales archaeon]
MESEPLKRHKTYVSGFDENIGGGIPQGHIVFIAGVTGSMKSSLAYSILFNNAKNEGVNGLYISLEQSRATLVRQMEGMGFIGETLGRLEVLDLGEIRLSSESPDWFDTFRFAVGETKRRLNYELLIIDSLGALQIMSRFQSPREDIFRFFEWLRSLKITTFIISEMPVGPYSCYGTMDTDFLSDGIIHMSMAQVGDTEVHRRIRCVKMRDTDHANSYFSFLKSKSGFSVTRAISEF